MLVWRIQKQEVTQIGCLLNVATAVFDLAAALLERGANPNATGRNGTTVLMYAKTALMGQTSPDLTFLEALITAGAEASRCDCYGKTVAAYVQNDPVLLDYFTQHGA